MERTNVWAKRAHSRDTRDSGDMKSENPLVIAKIYGVYSQCVHDQHDWEPVLRSLEGRNHAIIAVSHVSPFALLYWSNESNSSHHGAKISEKENEQQK